MEQAMQARSDNGPAREHREDGAGTPQPGAGKDNARQPRADGRVVEYARLEVAGYLGRDAQVVKTQEREFVSLAVGSTRSWRAADDQQREQTVWVKVLVFGERAEALKSLKKGAPLYAVGPLTYDRWEDASGPRHAPVVRVTDRGGDVQAAPLPGGQHTRVTLSGVIGRDAWVQRGTGDNAASRGSAHFGVQARGSHSVQLYGPLVEHVSERLKAGHGVRLEGRLELQRWQDKEGKPHERATIVVGGADSQIRVGREALPAPAPDPSPKPLFDLAAPVPMRAPDRTDRARR